MQQRVTFDEQQEEGSEAGRSTASRPEERRSRRWSRKHSFIHWEPEAQLRAFLAWLPKELHDAPGVDWAKLPPRIMGYCIKMIGNDPDAPALAMAAASLQGAMAAASQRDCFTRVHRLFQSLRETVHMKDFTELKQEQIWVAWAVQHEKQRGARNLLAGYATVATNHFPRYLLRLELTNRQRMQQYALPPPPVDLRKNYFPHRLYRKAQQEERKAASDILVPLYPVLRQLVRLRKELAERVLLAFRAACRKVETGEATLPYHFQHTDVIPEVNRDAKTIAEIRLQGREVVIKLILWDKRIWVEHHPDHYTPQIVRRAGAGRAAYTQDQNRFFVQLDSPASDCLWFGDLIEHRVLQGFKDWDTDTSPEPEGYQERWQYARRLGFPNGCVCGPNGLLDSGDRWFALAAERNRKPLFEPESLYRGILYGAALAMLALSNGSRMNELLQVSWNKERRVIRTEMVTLLDEKGHPQRGADGQPLTKEVKLHFQYLLPKGAKTDEERQLFPLSKESLRLLGEMKALLEETHGEIPVVAPSRSNAKYESLKPERYLFQWDAWPGNPQTCLSNTDVLTLLRFILHGLGLSTAQGRPIRVSVHLLRHVMATHARRYRNVPPEVIAHFFLHHRLKELTGHEPSLSEVSEYYTLMTEEQRFAVVSADLDEQEEMDHQLLQMAPTIRNLEQKNEDIRAVYEIWHCLHPTALGNCGCPGLCPRGNDRSLCLGCSYHVEDPEKLGAALAWRESYAQQAALFEAQGNAIDARQARIKVQLLDDMIAVMRMQLQEEATGRYIPVFRVLPSPHRKKEADDRT